MLVCDFDPQANSTSGFGVDKTTSPNIYDVLFERRGPAQGHGRYGPYGDVLPSNKALAGASIEMIGLGAGNTCFKKALDQLKARYDYILIDCPPLWSCLPSTPCARRIPCWCRYSASITPWRGLSDLLSTIRIVKRSLNPEIALEGVVLTMYDGRTNLSMQVAEEVKRHFPGQVYATVIPRNVRLSEAPSHGKPVCAMTRLSRGAEAYDQLARGLVEHNRYAVTRV